ncbi:NYN domain-containing protein [Xylanimonas protaetiae]|uniref:NYN domain-containing protein n=1 Tax=Xylanimonas protaetiae TaxID=2509457 RepID=UPI001F5C9D9E|nr:NYN domain-containing protein [Xylanimonas protaetiae]
MQFDFGPIADALAVRGRVVVRRAYADWSYFDEDRRALTRHQVELIEMTQRMGASRKNAADIKMVVDAIEMAFEREYISTFVMCTGDSDFSPLVHKLRELNKRVIGVGVEKSTSRLLPAACDEFLFYDRLEGVDVPDVDETAVRSARGGRGRGRTEPKHRSTRAAEAVAEVLAGAAPTPDAAAAPDAAPEAAPAETPARSRGRRKPSASKAAEPAPSPAPEPAPVDVVEPAAEEAPAGDHDAVEAPTMEVQVAQTLADLAASTSGAVTASMLKRTLLRKDPTFAESDYGFRTFTEFLEFLAERELVALSEGPAGGDPEVSLPKQGTSDETFALVRDVVVEAGAAVPLSGLKNRLRKRRPDFSEKALGFRGFLQFCRAAEAAGAVALTWDDDADDYLVTAA